MSNQLKVRYWKVEDPTKFPFPELQYGSPLSYEPLKGRANSGICISGGGTVSASLIAGYFKALSEANLMERISYISGVSGGCWGSTPFAYLQDLPDADFFAGVKSVTELKEHPKTIEDVPKHSMTDAVTNAPIAKLTIKGMAHKHEAYARAVGEIFLQPFNIHSPNKLLEKRHYFTADQSSVADIISRNASLKKEAEDGKILTMAQDRPYLIMNTTMLLSNGEGYDQFLCEVTPNYAGIFAKQNVITGGVEIGGSYVESIGFNTKPVALTDGLIETTSKYRFELCEPVGTSGSAIEEMVLKNEGLINELKEWLPQYNYWNPAQFAQDPANVQQQEIYFGDGGIIENTGIIPLLLRKVQNIAAFISQPVYLEQEYVGEKDAKVGMYQIFGYNQIASLFGAKLIKAEKEDGKEQVLTFVDDVIDKQVFDNTPNTAGKTVFDQLLDQFYAAKLAGGPLVVKMDLKVIDNPVFGVSAGTATVIWSVIDTCKDFEAQLPSAIKDEIGKPGELKDFPVVKVFGQNIPKIIELKPKQANLLGALANWMIDQKMDLYKDVLDAGTIGE